MNKINLLRGLPLFSNLGKKEIQEISRFAYEKKFRKGNIVFSQGEQGSTLFIIIKGRVKVSLIGENGKEFVLAVLRKGDFLGEMSIIEDEVRSATVTTIEPTVFLTIEKENFLNFLIKNPNASLGVLRELSKRLRSADEKIGELAFQDVYARVVSYLNALAKATGVKEKDEIFIADLPTKREIAEFIGSTRESVSRVLNDLNRKGYISLFRKSVLLRRKLKINEIERD
ncbi:MAG: Crp/Fnr family transcriptional regulator [Candidatus Aminicenantia bacterium]